MTLDERTKRLIDATETYAAHNYAPLPIVIESAKGVWVTDVDGHRYLDFLSAYSALNFGHCNERIAKVAHAQIDKLTLTSRAFYSEQFALLAEDLAKFCRKDKVLVMNSGAEAVETSIKAARRWAYDVKKIPENHAEIITCDGNFHGRTTTVVSFSTSDDSRRGFGPYTPGFVSVPFGDAEAVEGAITAHTAAVMVEPIQGEGGVIIPPDGYLTKLREICTRHNVLLIADEIQTGMCRTGKIFACDHENVDPDIIILAKSLGGGIAPISSIAADDAVMRVFSPGSHGSTMGGNPLACAIAREVIAIIQEEKPHERAADLGEYAVQRLRAMNSPIVKEVRGRGLLIGIDIDPAAGTAKDFCKKLKYEGLLCKDTRSQTLRVAPPLIITKEELDLGLEKFEKVLVRRGE
jgi:ornithine--oxo-acid transaminase